MKICYILPHFYPHIGGSEQAFLDLIVELKKKKDVNVRVITSSSGGKVGAHEHMGVEIYSYDWKLFFGHPIVKKKDLIEHIKWADVVQVGVYSPVIPTIKLCKKYNKPSIVTVHEVLGDKWYLVEDNKIKALLFKEYEKMNVKVNCTFYHTPSNATKKDLEECNKNARVENIYWISDKKLDKVNINTNKFYDYFGINKDNIVFLNYGRPGKTKGIFVYLNAIEKVIKKLKQKEIKNIKFCFIMANDPIKEKQKFLKLVKEKGLENYVIVRNSVDRSDLENYIECANYVVVPSITEGFGLTAIEACEKGKKLIHSSGGSLPEVTFGKTMQFENQNSDDLAKCIETVIKNPDSFKDKEKKDFSKKTICNQFYKLYEKAIQENGKDV